MNSLSSLSIKKTFNRKLKVDKYNKWPKRSETNPDKPCASHQTSNKP